MIKESLEELSKIVSIFIGIGNHDLVYFQQDSKTRRHEVLSKELDFWKKINSSKEENLHISSLPINNPTITKWTFNKDIDITALNLPIEYYWRKELTREFEEYLEIIKSITINTEKFNILLCHSPKNIIKNGAISDYLNYLKSFNLILSGHMHGGLVPKIFRKNSFGGGLFGPYASILPKHAYGIVQTDNTISLTSTGITKIANSTEIKSLTNNIVARSIIDFVYPPEIEILDLNPGKSYTIKRSK
jgi:predicted MPP superfamily phosphohydrolase